jgi:catecholate siderophore receptor
LHFPDSTNYGTNPLDDQIRYVPGITTQQAENNRDQLIVRGNNTSADFFVNGVRDDVQYFRDIYNIELVEALKGPNAMIFGRGGAGGVVNRVQKEAGFQPEFRKLSVNCRPNSAPASRV